MDVCEILKFVAENPRIPFYRFIFLYHENMEFHVFCGIFNEIFKKFQILFFPYKKLQLLINNVFISPVDSVIASNTPYRIYSINTRAYYSKTSKKIGLREVIWVRDLLNDVC